MFDNNDFDHIKKMETEMADGLLDASDSHEILEEVTQLIAETDFSSDESRMELMMKCINVCYEEEDGETVLVEDNVFSTILALCFNYSNLATNLIASGFEFSDYLDHVKNEILPGMREEFESLPYWNMDEQ